MASRPASLPEVVRSMNVLPRKSSNGTVADFVGELSLDDVPEPVLDQLLLAVLDLSGTAAAAVRTPMSVLVRDYCANAFPAGASRSRLLFDGRMCSVPGAALANGTTLDSLDLSDGHNEAKGHAGAPAFAALLAVADSMPERVSGRDFLAAMVVAYEIGLRSGVALHRQVSEYHGSGTWACIGVAAAAARLVREPVPVDHALGIAEYNAPRAPISRCTEYPTMVKDGLGWASMVGVTALEMARAGFTGAPAGVLHESGRDIWLDLGSRWYLLELYFRMWSACRMAHPSIEATVALVKKHRLRPGQIRTVEVVTFAEATKMAKAIPASIEEAQYSLPFSVSSSIVFNEIGINQLSAEVFKDPEIQRIAGSVRLVADEEYSKLWPIRRVARVAISLADGSTVTSEEHESKGDPRSAYPPATMRAKYDRATIPFLGEQRSAELAAHLLGLDRQERIDGVLDSLLSPRVAQY
ncbi:MAG: MmgE/PrpD family protein [Mesorhizobium sp.]|nr:MAG: MmgE/PrpD family protein [Mesorhizobium sp.]